MRRRVGFWGGVVASGAVAALGGTALGQGGEARTLFAFEHAGLSAMMPDDQDAELRRAMMMIPTRLIELSQSRELRRELGDIPPGFIQMGWDAMTRPTRMIVTNRGTNPETGQPLLGAIVSIKMRDEGSAMLYHGQIMGLLAASGEELGLRESRRIKGMQDFSTPMGPVSFGPREGGDGWRYELLFGSAPGPEGAFADMPRASDGAETVMSFRLDLGEVTPLLQPFIGMAMAGSPEAATQMERLREAGLIGPDASTIEYTMGFTASNTVQETRMIGIREGAELLNMAVEPLEQRALSVIPRDASAFYIYQSDVRQQWEGMMAQLGPMAGEVRGFLREFESEVGVDVVEDVIETFGSTSAVYLSDSTGGGSLMSVTLVQSLDDGARLRGAMEKLTSAAGGFIEQNMPTELVGVDLGTKRIGDVSMTQLRVNGVPAFLTPSFSISEGHLVAALTPQACYAATMQTRRRANDSILANGEFTENFGRFGEPVAISFVDTKRTMGDGYGLLQFGANMLSTFVSSPDGSRDPGIVLPSLGSLRDGAKPMISVSRWEGDDLVQVQTGDRSMLVNLAGALGVGDAGSLLIGALVGSGVTAGILEGIDDGDWDDDWDDDWEAEWEDEDDDVDF